MSGLFKGGAVMMENAKKGILHNRYVLYFVVIAVMFNMITHALHGNYVIPLMFILISLITSCFSKNMIVILLVGAVFANLFVVQLRKRRDCPDCREGMANEEEEVANDATAEVDEAPKTDGQLNVEDPSNKMAKRGDYKGRKKDFDFIRKKYGELVKIQEELMKNVGSLEGSMANMDYLVEDVKKNINTIRADMGMPENAGTSSAN